MSIKRRRLLALLIFLFLLGGTLLFATNCKIRAEKNSEGKTFFRIVYIEH